MNYQQIFNSIGNELKTFEDTGEVAAYIPELKKVDPNQFGAFLTTIEGEKSSFGDFNTKFSIQSIAKVFALTMAYTRLGEYLWERVDVEPSGKAYNSIVQLETDLGLPRNPLINAGALVVSDILVSSLKNPKTDFIDFVREIANNNSINYSERIANSEKLTGFRNAALINLMKSFGNIENDIDEVLDFYFNLCSIEMTCEELSTSFLYLANHGKSYIHPNRIISKIRAKRINSIMQLCGFYDEAGEFAFKVGLPGKSGVGGGIAAICPCKYSIAVWSPKLNIKGNSTKGIEFLERFTTATEYSIF